MKIPNLAGIVPQLGSWLIGLLIVVMLFGGVYLLGRSHGAGKVQAKWDASLLEAQRALSAAQQSVIEKERENAELAKRIGDELKPALDAATRRAADLARSLREYQERSRRLAVSLQACATVRPDGTPRESPSDDGVGAATQSLIESCARDAERLGALQTWVRGVQ